MNNVIARTAAQVATGVWGHDEASGVVASTIPPVDPDQLLAERYSCLAPAYACLWSPVITPMGESLLQALPLSTAAQILDIGTGTGALLPIMHAAAPHATVVGVDRSDGMLQIARTVTDAPLALMDGLDLALRPASFDVAVLAFVLFHFSDPVQGLVEAAHVLRPGGTVGLLTWSDDPSFPAASLWDEELEAYGAAPEPIYQRAHDRLMDTPEKVEALLAQAGFTSIYTWTEQFEHRWDCEGLFTLRVHYGAHRWRLDTLAPQTRAAFLACVRTRLARMKPEAFVYRPTVVIAVAQRATHGEERG